MSCSHSYLLRLPQNSQPPKMCDTSRKQYCDFGAHKRSGVGFMFYSVYTISEQELTGFSWSYLVHNVRTLFVITPSNVVMSPFNHCFSTQGNIQTDGGTRARASEPPETARPFEVRVQRYSCTQLTME